MVGISNENVPGHLLLLEMTFQAEGLVSLGQHPLVDRAVWRMADHTTLTHRLVLINKRAALRGVALEAGFISAQERKAAALKHLLNIGPTTFDRDTDVRIMAIRTAHFPLQHRVMMRQVELCAYLKVTLETSFRRLTRIDDCVRRAATLDVQTARSMTRFAADVLCVFSFRLQTRVRRGPKIPCDIFVTSLTTFRASELRAWDTGRC